MGFGCWGLAGGVVLGVGDGQGEDNGAEENEKDASPEIRKDSHHLKLYSECWTGLLCNCERSVCPAGRAACAARGHFVTSIPLRLRLPLVAG